MPGSFSPESFPVDEAVPHLKKALSEKGVAILKAPPGSGKTTVVPLRLMNEPWLAGKKIWVLEPRRIAARLAALRMAEMTGTRVGGLAGYHVRMERKAGPETVIEVLTEGILTRRIQSDPMIEETGLVIFDEFHERSIHADLGLALCLEIREVFRNDLKILVMSATMDTEKISALMGNAPVINASGKMFPVEVIYEKPASRPKAMNERIENRVASRIFRAADEKEGDILVFLPGTGEIRKTADILSKSPISEIAEIHQLHGNLSLKDQENAIRPNPSGRRKIVLSTSIAETSLTIEGVRTVIDCGLSRVPRFNPSTGMTSLETVPVSVSSAEQRRGRAGRLAPGRCYRMWPENTNHMLPEFSLPEIKTSDLCPFALEIAMWGASSPSDLRLLDQPQEGAFNQSVNLLKMLGALDKHGLVTDLGREMSKLGVHPRLAAMLIYGKNNGLALTASRIAALIGERDILVSGSEPDEDIRTRLEILEKISKGDKDSRKRADFLRCQRVLETASYLEKQIKCHAGYDSEKTGLLLSVAYPERIAKKRTRGSFLTRSAGGAFLTETSHLADSEYLVIANLAMNANNNASRRNAKIFLATKIDRQDIEKLFGRDIKSEIKTEWNEKTLSVESRKNVSLDALVLEEKIEKRPQQEDVLNAMISGIRKGWPEIFPWTEKAKNLQARAAFLRSRAGFDHLHDISFQTLEKNLDDWLKPYLSGITRADDLKKLDVEAIFMTILGWENSRLLESEAPEKYKTPSGSNLSIDYSAFDGTMTDGHPVLKVKLQEMFGIKATPCIGSKKIPLTLHLLSPASRPIQITMDLENFWKSGYLEVKKELKGRYPRHFWPDDPVNAQATRGPKPRTAQNG
ncbi:ATP-dependent helicase HrpB [Desulforegula conservatrix]|uniref:ATP-dependent helicase HrpB n=1 Tax=Desulforegula conservatrix TaxID=153026 RepID=UPI00041F2433|nr:ATP-dependent helicase HrpB [Desulforegula conservatrix]